MINKSNEARLLVFLTLIALLCGCGGPPATQTETAQPSNRTTLPSTSGVLGLQPTVTATVTLTPTPTPKPTSAPIVGRATFTTQSVGSPLPSDAECAARVPDSSWEPRPDNTTANYTNVYAQGYRLTGSDLNQYGYQQRVTGNFTGTTDEILQWGACKWGIDVDIVRAIAVQESYWRQSDLGDCHGGRAAGGCQSVGILQVKGADQPPTHPGTWPYAAESTAFDVDYTLAVLRACFEGKETWLGNGYQAGDIWGCVGRWYSGDWYVSSGNYIASVKNLWTNKDWLKPSF